MTISHQVFTGPPSSAPPQGEQEFGAMAMALAGAPAPTEARLEIEVDGVTLFGDLVVPPHTQSLVVFAHGSGSSRHSPRSRWVAQALQASTHATLLFDLLTTREELADAKDGHLRFNIAFLARRLVAVSRWLAEAPGTRDLAMGYFGASTGAAAALVAAAELGPRVGAIVSRGGRPDLAADAVSAVVAPTLLIVGSQDMHVLRLNQQVLSRLHCKKELLVVQGATHLFEEAGALETVAQHAARWFSRHLNPQKSRSTEH
jgi:pimeloyl-ACP methyl ester carboxylesterase